MKYIKASKIIKCELVRQNDLPFGFYNGACNTFQSQKQTVLMCFDNTSGRKDCHT